MNTPLKWTDDLNGYKLELAEETWLDDEASDGCIQNFLYIVHISCKEYYSSSFFHIISYIFVNHSLIRYADSSYRLFKVKAQWIQGHKPPLMDHLLGMFVAVEVKLRCTLLGL